MFVLGTSDTSLDDRTQAEYEAKCQRLRVDLKTWESNWAKNNGGTKPGRDDIKRNPDIGRSSYTIPDVPSPDFVADNDGK
jgi:hypothetical protein